MEKMAKPLNFSKTILAVISGTGRGIGKTITQLLGKKLVPGSKIVAISNLPDKAQQMSELQTSVNKDVSIDMHIRNLSLVDLGEYEAMMDMSLKTPSVKQKSYEYGLIIHNAGSLGSVEKTTTLQNVDVWRKYYDLNFFSTIILNTIFMRKCQPYMNHIFIVNISSIFSIRSELYLSMYCSCGAARNSYFSILAAEELRDATVMSYSPGPAETQLFKELSSNRPLPEGFKTISTEDTATKLLRILAIGNYKSGSFVDVFSRTV